MARRRPLFTIGAVARMLELPPATIRTWESRYGLVVPERSDGGQRLYSRELVERLRFVKERVDGGARPADAHRLLGDRIAGGSVSGEAPLRVLLAERRLGAAESLRRLFGSDAIEVVLAADVETAQAIVGELAPALVVVDTDDDVFTVLVAELRDAGTKVLPIELLERPLALVDAARAAREA